jgi:hypothetical protein
MKGMKGSDPWLEMRFMPSGRWKTDGPPLSIPYEGKARNRGVSVWRSSGLGKKEREDIDGTVRNHLAALIDLIHCLENGKEPLCGLNEGTSTVAFVSSVFESYRHGGKDVHLPLTSRGNPLLR